MTLRIDGADSAILGMAFRCGQPPIIVYGDTELVAHFVGEGMTEEEAEEWIQFNIVGAWVGEDTPAVLARMTVEEIEEACSE